MTHPLQKAWLAYQQGVLLPKMRARMRPYVSGLKYLVHDPAARAVTLHCPEYVQPARFGKERALVERIFRSYKKIKEAQQNIADVYRPASIWQEHLDQSYAYVLRALREDDVDTFHFFLANFGAWKSYIGIESASMVRAYAESLVARRYLTNVLFHQQLRTWKWFYGERKAVSCLSYPLHGNQIGAYIDGHFVGVGSFFNEIYGSLLKGLIGDRERPVVADLGAGYGKLAYFTLREVERSCFIDFDLAEPLCLAAYYLMLTWPGKSALLYGEEEYSSAAHGRYDLVFMPAHAIDKLADKSVDLFVNKNSLGAMTSEAVVNYVAHIARSTRYFFHMNHELYPNVYAGERRGLLGHEYPVPMSEFKLLFRYPDLGAMLHQGVLDYSMDIFSYLYERTGDDPRSSAAAARPISGA